MIVDENKISEIKQSSDIVDVISSYLPLEKKGQNYFGVCPFHQDNSPSMSVSPQKQIFKCFSCGASGNVISFVMDYENISFIQSLKKLADLGNIDFNYQTTNVKQIDSNLKRLYEINDSAAKLFNFQLHKTKNGNEQLENLTFKRKLTKEILEFFNIGFATNDDSILKLLQKKYDEDLILETALVNKNDSRIYDNFKNKIIIPIYDDFNNIVGFSGRAIDDSKPKYINSRETIAFKKSEVLYNFYHASKHVKQKKRILITEGYFDVIKAYQNDIKEVVATMGTALNSKHFSKFSKLNCTVYFCMDSDDAGQSAMFNILSKINFSKIYVVNLLEAKDLDDFLDLYSKEALEVQIKNAQNHISFQIEYLFKKTNLNDQFQKRELITNVMNILNKVDDHILKETFLNDFASRLNISKDLLYETKVKEIPVTQEIVEKQNTDAEFELLMRMLLFPDVIKIFQKEIGVFENPNYTSFAFEIIDHYQNYSNINLDVFEMKLLANNKLNLLSIFIKIKDQDDLEKSHYEIIELVYFLKKKKITHQRKILENKRSSTPNDDLLKLELEIIKLKQIEDKIETEKKYYEENLNERL